MKPVLKYVGGKTKLLPELLQRIPDQFNDYYEPFFGSGALFFRLCENDEFLDNRKCNLSDYNEQLMIFYQFLAEEPDKVIETIKSFDNNKETYYKVREEFNLRQFDVHEYSDYRPEQAGRFYYLNKNGFSGLYRVTKRGSFNVPYGNYKNPSYKFSDLINASKILNKCNVICRHTDYRKALASSKKDDFVYLDPPYAQTFNSYTEEQKFNQVELKIETESLDRNGIKFLLSNSYCDEVMDLYKNFKIEIISTDNAFRTSNKRVRREVLIYNY